MAAADHLPPGKTLMQTGRYAFIRPAADDAAAQTLNLSMDADGWNVARIGREHVPVLTADFPLRLIQPGHLQNGDQDLASHLGEFQIEGLNDFTQKLLLLPLTIVRQGFRLFTTYEGGANESKNLLCYSLNGVTPSPRVAKPFSPVCAEFRDRGGLPYRRILCPQAVWRGNDRPLCRDQTVVAFFDLDRKIPLRFQVQGTGMSAWNALRREYQRALNVARLRGSSINDFVIVMTARNHGSYSTPEFSMRDCTRERPSRYLPLLRLYLDTLYAPRDEEEEPVPAGDAGETLSPPWPEPGDEERTTAEEAPVSQ